MEAKVEVVSVSDDVVTVKDRNATWWLGNREQFNLPRDEKLQNAKPGDIITISLKEQD